ncbi:MAG: uroporphyrinogen-III synthase [Gammaproteobacteria bacterium]|nr:uroporphyrinogen-III synthase [Gammaproteobacteria bacterium]MDH5650329.1 uroporphyrinogen-III synthase [Gammaproteobacteria bacterium]
MTSDSLQHLGVLVTRPAHQAESLCRLIEDAGGRAFRFPVIAIEPPDEPDLTRAQLAALSDFDMAIFISPNAVSFSRQLLDSLPTTCRIVAVGQGTARQLLADFQREPDVIPESGFHSEALLAMPALKQVAGQRVMILRGEDGRPLLGDTLRERGAEVIYATVYKRVRPAASLAMWQEAIAERLIHIIVVTSGEGLQNLWYMAGEQYRSWLSQIPLLLINPRLIPLAEKLGYSGKMIVAENAGDTAILHGLQAGADKPE